MSYTRRTRRNDYYLDVSDFVLTDPRQVIPSPRCTPVSLTGNDILTPGNLPLIIEIEGVNLSPYFEAHGPVLDIQFYDFTLEMPEEHYDNDGSEEQDSSENNQIYEKDNIILEEPEQEEQQELLPEPEYSRFNLAYFNEALTELKKMKATPQEMKQFVREYLTDADLADKQIAQASLQKLIKVATENLRPIGPISWLERKFKVNKYIQKKKKRVWKKKISYDCRKRVADNRLRVKGKFVTKKQACNLLGVDELNEDQIKILLESKTTKDSY